MIASDDLPVDVADGSDESLRDQIARIEVYLEELTETLESCRKFMVAAKFAIAIGGLAMIAMLLGLVRADPMGVVAALTATIAGIVLLGSNASTWNETSARIKRSELLRAELIGRLALQPTPTLH